APVLRGGNVMVDDPMTREDEQAKLRSYLAAQSAKLSAGEIRTRLETAAEEFFAAVGSATDAAAHTPPAPGEWSVAEILDHVTFTLEDATEIMRTLAAGRPARSFQDHQPRPGMVSIAERLARLRRSQAAVSDLLAACSAEPHTDNRVADGVFGDLNWKGYAL